MATFEIIEGPPGQGKSLYTARIAKQILHRNAKWAMKTGVIRKLVSNIKFSEEFENEWKEFIEYWVHPEELVKLRDCDVIWDEIATELDARNYMNLSDELKRFLSQYRKRGVDIYANTQDFSMIDARARLMVTRVATLLKVIGSRDPSPTKPPVKYIWGLVFVRDVKNFKVADPEKKQYGLIPGMFLIDRIDVEIYDTRQDISAGALPPKKLRKQVEFFEGDEETDPFKREKYV